MVATESAPVSHSLLPLIFGCDGAKDIILDYTRKQKHETLDKSECAFGCVGAALNINCAL